MSQKMYLTNIKSESNNCQGGQPYEGGDDVAEPTVSSIGQKVFHLPDAQKIKFIYRVFF